MSTQQNQCPWCSRLGPRHLPRDAGETWAQPHADGSDCVCRHVTAQTELGARDAHGRYFDPEQGWVCFGCDPDPSWWEAQEEKAVEVCPECGDKDIDDNGRSGLDRVLLCRCGCQWYWLAGC